MIPIITPRFALSVDMDFMQKLGVLAKEENLRIQVCFSFFIFINNNMPRPRLGVKEIKMFPISPQSFLSHPEAFF